VIILRLVLFLMLALPTFALSNKITIRDGGSGQSSATFDRIRYFARDEICGYPQPFISGSSAASWQSHVMTRWPSSAACPTGSARLSLVVFIASISNGGTLPVEFRSNLTDSCHLGSAATCDAAGASKSQILDFDTGAGAGSWGAKITATTGGISLSRSARQMITDNHYRILFNGPIFVKVWVREDPRAVSAATTRTTNFGWQCTATCTNPYASATWADNSTYYSIRPTFELNIYRSWGKVRGDFVAHSAWNDRHVDQRIESFTIYRGGAETTAAITQGNAIILAPRHGWTEGPWWDGGDPNPCTTDHNIEYLIYSGLVPQMDLDRYDIPNGSAAGTIHVNSFNSTDQGVTTNATISPERGRGNYFSTNLASAGSNSYTGLYSRWGSHWLRSQDSRFEALIERNARGLSAFPWVWLEGTAGTSWTSGSSTNSFGMPISIEMRSDFIGGLYGQSNIASRVSAGNRPKSPEGHDILTTCAHASCMVQTHQSNDSYGWYTARNSAYTNTFLSDRAHQPEDFMLAFLITGKFLWREMLIHQASWSILSSDSSAPSLSNLNARWGTAGIIWDTSNWVRGHAWPVRTLARAVLMADDGSPEKIYLGRRLDYWIEAYEGFYGVTNGSFPPATSTAPYGCPSTTMSSYYNTTPSYSSAWCFGRYFYGRGVSNDMWIPAMRENFGGTPPAGQGVDYRYGSGIFNMWMSSYLAVTLGHMRDLGFPVAKVQESVSKLFLRMAQDKGCNRDHSCFSYGQAIYTADASRLLATPEEMRATVARTSQLSRAIGPTDTTIRYATLRADIFGPVWSIENTGSGGPIQIGTEYVQSTFGSGSGVSLSNGVITAADDRITFPGPHAYSDGDLIEFNPVNSGIRTDMPITADPTRCSMPSGKGHCRWFVKSISTNVIEVYKDSGLTDKVDFSADQSSIRAGYVSFTVASSSNCGKSICRGLLGTTASSWPAGTAIASNGSFAGSQFTNGGTGWAYGYNIRTALAYAATYPPSPALPDSTTGEKLDPMRAFRWWSQSIPAQDQSGNKSTACGTADNCGANRWMYVPSTRPTSVRVTSPTAGNLRLQWVAPNGKACRVAAGVTLASSDDSSDVEGAGRVHQEYTFGGLPAGTVMYRITCQQAGRVLGTAVVQ